MASCVILDKPGGPDSLRLSDNVPGVPSMDEALTETEIDIEILAVSLNYRDIAHVRHLKARNLPWVPCSDCVGVVTRCGPDCNSVRPGDRVCPLFFPLWRDGPPESLPQLAGALGGANALVGGMTPGVLRRRMRLREEQAIKVPAYLSDAEASTLPCAALTAWTALTDFGRGGLKKGDVVLLEGTGGVSLFALLFAKALGLRVIITSSSDAKLQRCQALGADATINYKKTPRWGRAAARIGRDGMGVDLVVDVGGPTTLGEALDALRIGGRVAMLGNLGGRGGAIRRLDRVFYKAATIRGVVVGNRRGFNDMLRAMRAGHIRPIIDMVFAMDGFRGAFARAAGPKGFGKVVISLADSSTSRPRAKL